MRKSTFWIALGAAAVGAGATLLIPGIFGFDGNSRAADSGGPPWDQDGPSATVVETRPVERGTYSRRGEFVGTLQAKAAADLHPKLSGQVVELRVDTGDTVTAGQLLARIEDDQQRQELAQQRAALLRAEANLAQRRAALAVAESTGRRVESLSAQNLLPQQAREDAEGALLSARAQVAVAEAQVQEAQAQVDAARVALARTRVRAPFAGRIGKRYLDEGARATTDRTLFSLVDSSVIKTTVPMTAVDATRVREGQTAELESEVFPGERFAGRVARQSAIYDPQTHTTEVEMEFPNPDGRLQPGMFATVTLEFDQVEEALTVPARAIVQATDTGAAGQSFVFVAEEVRQDEPAGEDGPETRGATRWRARRLPVRVLGGSLSSDPDAQVPIQALDPQLTVGVPVITLGQDGLAPGASIRLARDLQSTRGRAPAEAPAERSER